MADTLKVLGQAYPSATTETTLYQVPDNDFTVTTVSSLVVCNQTASPITFRVSVSVADAATTSKDYLYYGQSLAANTTYTAVLGMTLGQLDDVRVYVSAQGISFNLFGVETSS